ncbi:MAG: UbiX family flavin prenyltransferase [Gammaproteobacteria bacterium]|jgi:4-hydroxy-3-polyprenylbenzoate decarboxylase|nr:UbiX family flavin prenyltransferase [Gammaproteobacteria bacterium]
MRLVIGISGSSGVIYGIRLLEVLRGRREVETHLVISQGAKLNIALETDWKPREVEALADYAYADRDLAAPISSGSFLTAGMIIVPCSIKTLSGVVNSYADNLLVRAADVSLKEGRRLVLVPRESPLHVGHTRLLHEAATLGALICPPMPAFYNAPRTIADLIDHSIGRLLDLFGIDNDLARRWEGPMGTPEEIQAETQVDTPIGTQFEIQMGAQASDSRQSGKG